MQTISNRFSTPQPQAKFSGVHLHRDDNAKTVTIELTPFHRSEFKTFVRPEGMSKVFSYEMLFESPAAQSIITGLSDLTNDVFSHSSHGKQINEELAGKGEGDWRSVFTGRARDIQEMLNLYAGVLSESDRTGTRAMLDGLTDRIQPHIEIMSSPARHHQLPSTATGVRLTYV